MLISTFNRFQQLLSNFQVEWTKTGQPMVNMLGHLLSNQRQQQSNNQLVTEDRNYGHELFDYFCKQRDRVHIIIQKFTTLPEAFIENKELLFAPITNIFPHLAELILNELEISEFLVTLEKYIRTIDNFIQLQETTKNSNLSKINSNLRSNRKLKKYDSKLDRE